MPAFLPFFIAANALLLNIAPNLNCAQRTDGCAAVAPAGTPLHVRLTGAVGTFASRSHSPVAAMLIAPVKFDGEIVLPSGSLLRGEVKAVRRVGFGVIHETASMQLDFQSVTLPSGEEFPLGTRLAAVDNAREVVTPHGTIQRGRSTGSLGNRAAAYIRSLALLDVHVQLAVWALKATIVQVPEPEIYLPTGTELTLTLTEPVRALAPDADSGEPRPLDAWERDLLEPVVAELPSRTFLPGRGALGSQFAERPSDLINVVFIGSREQVAAAFTAAGWTEARPRAVHSDLASVWAMVRNTPVPDAPLSPQFVNDVPADMNWQKGFNDFSKRHHIRLWENPDTWDGEQVWVGAATRDVDFAYFRKGKPMTHEVARLVDNEREKIASDVAFTSCADAVDWVERPDVPLHMKNATGDRMQTDGRILVMRLNDCAAPRKVGSALDFDTLPEHGGPFQRVLRRQIMCFRSDFLRTNIYWRSFEGARMLIAAFRHKQVDDPDAQPQPTFASRWYPDGLNNIISYR